LQTNFSHIKSTIELNDLPCTNEDKVCQYVKQNKTFPAAEETKEPALDGDYQPWRHLNITSSTSGRSYMVGNNELGSGAFGRVYLAAELDDQGEQKQFLAAKVLLSYAKFASDEDFRTEIAKEFLMQNAVRNDHVVRAEDALLSDRKPIIMMEFVHGGDLKFVPSTGFSEVELKRYVVQLVDGLAAIHALNFTHLDLKLANCILDHTGKLKWTDFGLAEVCEHDTGCKLGDSRGTLYYMAPELLSFDEQGHVTFGKKSDVWSLGAIFYEMLYGHSPFSMKGKFFGGKAKLQKSVEVTSRIKRAKYNIAETRFKGDERFRQLIKRMLVVDPASRVSLQAVQQEVNDWCKE